MVFLDSSIGTSVGILKGVGPKTLSDFKRLGVHTLWDLINFYPRDYCDCSSPCGIMDVFLSKSFGCIEVEIVSKVEKIYTKTKKTVFKVSGFDGKDYLDLLFFNNPYAVAGCYIGKKVLLLGNIIMRGNKYEMVSPKIFDEKIIFPIYPQTKSLSSKKIYSFIKMAFSFLENTLKETLPLDILERYNLSSLEFSLKNIHFPKDKESLEKAKRRLIFEEILIWQIAVSKIKNYVKHKTEVKILKDFSDDFLFLLPFYPTKAQMRVIKECHNDIINKKGMAMSRLIQGDVGSGKTVIAASVAYTVAKNGYQVAVMVPTEILAFQHFKTFTDIFSGTKINISLLYGSMTLSKRKEIQDKLKNGEIDIIIGTHSLISQTLEFKNLGLVITDEQHRFGVRQRLKLTEKGDNPHTLIMSATPIPRTLSMIVYGDLDVSLIDELPPGRKKIQTFCINSEKRTRCFNFFKKIVDSGGQGYIVCPIIEKSSNDTISIEEYQKRFIGNLFDGYKTGVLHGKMKDQEKDEIMRKFVNGDIKILISTTVIEVGIDVPNASIIVIENAEKFGLSQIHQLRGRVGRGEKESFCILISSSKSDVTKKRLKAVCKSTDGFELAQEDLKIRGPGEIFGDKQHGMLGIKLAKTLKHTDILNDCKDAVSYIFSQETNLCDSAFKCIKNRVDNLISNSYDGKVIM